jgi:hypothetical protein
MLKKFLSKRNLDPEAKVKIAGNHLHIFYFLLPLFEPTEQHLDYKHINNS